MTDSRDLPKKPGQTPKQGEHNVTTTPQDCHITIRTVRIRNFRSLRSVDVDLDDLTLLLGENNSGKTSFLEAVHAAIGAGPRSISADDVFLAPEESKVPQDREIIIDLLIKPITSDGETLDSFPAGSYWLKLWGNAVSQDEQDNDFVAIRVRFRWDVSQGEYVVERKFLGNWVKDPALWSDAKVKEIAGTVSSTQIQPIALYMMDAKRDARDEIQNRGSFWYKLTSTADLKPDQIEKFEKILTDLNSEIISGSGVLSHIQDHLNEIHRTIPSDKGSVSIDPLTRHLRDLSRGIDVNFATKGAQAFPLARHGMGTRSMAAVLIFRAYMTWKQKNAGSDAVHPMLALEEPEAHLHPQAQRAFFYEIKQIPGQRIVSTHSPYIASQLQIEKIRHFRKAAAETEVHQLDTTDIQEDDLQKINRIVMATRGDLLFARVLILFEGETEDQAIPIFAEHYWQRNPGSIGISLIGVGGSGNYLPFLRLASSYGIPWYIFSDGESDAVKKLESALKKIGIPNSRAPNIFVLPNEYNFETYLISEGYEDAIIKMLETYHREPEYFKNWINKMHGQAKNRTQLRDYKSTDWRKTALIDILTDSKTLYGAPLARAILELTDSERQIPTLLRNLFDKISADLSSEPGSGLSG